MGRKIIHIDMDAFYASVEQRDNPVLKGKPIIVGGSPDKRGVVSTASYEARKYGVRSAMPAKRALQLCPHLIIVHPDFSKYKKISSILYNFYKEYTDLIEPLSLDECYLDVTSNKLNIPYATEIAERLRNKIKKELNLTASAGVAPNKFLAKIASDINKPDGIFIIKPGKVKNFMINLEVNKIWGVGKVTFKKLKELNIITCGDLQKMSMVDLVKYFGKYGETLYYFARGIDNREVISQREIKSIGSENTFYIDTNDIEIIRKTLLSHVRRISARMQEKNIKGKTITIKIKYYDFKQITRSITLDYFTNDEKEIYKACINLLRKTKASEKKIRLTGASVTNFDIHNTIEENGLFS